MTLVSMLFYIIIIFLLKIQPLRTSGGKNELDKSPAFNNYDNMNMYFHFLNQMPMYMK